MEADITDMRDGMKSAKTIRDKEVFHGIKVIESGQGKTIVDARFYTARSGGSVVYCLLWVNGYESGFGCGSGKAGGYGYHKESAALAEAIESAGIKLDKRIDGVGNGAMLEAINAIAKEITDEQCFTVEFSA